MFVDGVSQKPVQTPSLEAPSSETHQWRLHHPLGEHRNPFSILLDVFEVVEHFRYIIADGRRGA